MRFSAWRTRFPRRREANAFLGDAKLYRRERIDLKLMAGDWQDGKWGAVGGRETFGSSDTPSAFCFGILRRNPITHLFSGTSSGQGGGGKWPRERTYPLGRARRDETAGYPVAIPSGQFKEINCSFPFLRGALDLIAFAALNPSPRDPRVIM